jgi:serine/threonine-protein kinase
MSTPDPELTARVETDARPTPQSAPRSDSGHGQFAPGTVIAGRYRIAGLLGSGGMGEVYRADDTKLDQPVALKFLPARLARDQVLLARLHDEVRLGRQIAHPNVCRIYDIVDYGSAHFVAMEFVDGEDLARLLRRIGRLAPDKAVDITRGIAAGLMAAHAKGILHRDLKPANVMIDSRGDARIMDFGLALGAGDDDGTVSGTPAYMAPELFEGRAATVQSDLYALGLVMYELVTGKRAHNARTMPERARELSSEITTPSDVIRDVDPAVERIILRCLSNDPIQRPRSAREVIEALPGGDPLAAALAAGETPSPRIVAAAGTEGSLRPWQAWSLLAVALLLLAGVLDGNRRYGVGRYVSLDKPPEVLVERAQTIARSLGVPKQPFRSHRYSTDGAYMGWFFPKEAQRPRGRTLLVLFTLTERAEPLPPGSDETLSAPGTNVIEVDSEGRLAGLSVLPQRDWPARPLDWKPLLAAAGLDPAALKPAAPRRLPGTSADTRAAWEWAQPEGVPLHVEAAAWHGTPVFFAITGPWESASPGSLPFMRPELAIFAVSVMTFLIAAGVLLAWRNLRKRRGDRQGAFRVAGVMFVLTLVANLLRGTHYPSGTHEIALLQRSAADALLWSVITFLFYLALEPFVRRRWPAQLIASTRLLAGNHRDPMVGRDVLIGILFGIFHTASIFANAWASDSHFYFADLRGLGGVRQSLAHVVGASGDGALQAFIMVLVMTVLAMLLRRRELAILGLAMVMMTGYFAATGRVSVMNMLFALIYATFVGHAGLLAVAVSQAVFLMTFHLPLFATQAWSSINLLPIVVLAVLIVWAFRTSLGEQRAFAAVLDD